MRSVNLIVIMGLGQDVNETDHDCLGLRPFAARLGQQVQLQTIFANYTELDLPEQIALMPPGPVMLVGHSLGGARAIETAKKRMTDPAAHVDALCVLDPVPLSAEWINPFYRFDSVPHVPFEICFHSAFPWPIGWGRSFKDHALNVAVRADHPHVASHPAALRWITERAQQMAMGGVQTV